MPYLQKEVILRAAQPTDLDALVQMCKICFPDNYRWQSIYPIARKWWHAVVESKASQALVLEDSIGIFAYSVLVLDLALWREESRKRNGSRVDQIIAAISCPNIAVWKRLWKITRVRLTKKRPRRNSVVQKTDERTVWAESAAVLPRRRNQGFSLLLIKERERSAREAGATRITTHVDSENIPSRRMNEKMGFVLISEDIRGCIYEQSLVDSDKIIAAPTV